MLKIPSVKKKKYYVWEAVLILGLSLVFFTCISAILYWYIFDFNNKANAKKASIENALNHPYSYPKYRFNNLLKAKLFSQPE